MQAFWTQSLDLFIHLDQHLEPLILSWGGAVYAVMALTIFSETGLVVAAFLPGDVLLFTASALAAHGMLDIRLLAPLLFLAALAGDTANYWIGRFLGPRLFRNPSRRWLNPRHLEQAHGLYLRHGWKIILASRFIPLLRTLGPFVAGIGDMGYRRFLIFNAAGCAVWSSVYLTLGYYFAHLPAVQERLAWVVPAVAVVAMLPAGLVGLTRALRRKGKRP